MELAVDDGTGVVDAVLWVPQWAQRVRRGDLVAIDGKLQSCHPTVDR